MKTAAASLLLLGAAELPVETGGVRQVAATRLVADGNADGSHALPLSNLARWSCLQPLVRLRLQGVEVSKTLVVLASAVT